MEDEAYECLLRQRSNGGGLLGPFLKNVYPGSFTSNTSSFGPQCGAKQGAYPRVKGYKGKGEMEDVARVSWRGSEACQKQ